MSKHTFVWGFGVGWLSGVTEPSAAASIVSTLLAVFAGLATLGASRQRFSLGAQSFSADAPEAAPVTAAVIGLCLGHLLGVLARAHWL